MTTGSSADILGRVKKLVPKGWFRYAAPYRDAVMGGLADIASWNYNLIGYARAQTRLSTAYGIWLDVFSYDFLGRFLPRQGLQDDAYRVLIRATILQERVTRPGIINAVTTLTGKTPWVFEPWNTYDTGAYSDRTQKYGSMGYGAGRGGYGSMALPAQTFMKVTRTTPSGVPSIGGWGNTVLGYGVGAGEYVGSFTALTGVTDDVIYRLINLTKPTGAICWVAIGAPVPLAKRYSIFNDKLNSQNIAIL